MVNKKKILTGGLIGAAVLGGGITGFIAGTHSGYNQKKSHSQTPNYTNITCINKIINNITKPNICNETYETIIEKNITNITITNIINETTNIYNITNITANNYTTTIYINKTISNNQTTTIIPPSPSLLEKKIFGTNNSLVPLEVKNISQLSNNSVSMEVYNPYTGNATIVILPINEAYYELTNGSNIPLQSIMKLLPPNQNLYLILNILNPNNISSSGIHYIGNYNGVPIISLSENARIAYFISPFNGTDISNVLTAAMNGKAKTLIFTGSPVWNYENALWGWDNATSQSVIISGPSQLINYLKLYVKLSDNILGINTTNPGNGGVLPVIITQNYTISQYQSENKTYKVYNINPNDSIYGILLVPAEGHQIIPKIVNSLSIVPLIAPSAIASYNSRRKYDLSDNSPITL